MKHLRLIAMSWMALLGLCGLVWIISGIWLLHWPGTEGAQFVMVGVVSAATFLSAMYLAETS